MGSEMCIRDSLLGFHALNISDEIEDFVETHIYKMLIIILKYGVFLGRT